MFIDGEDFMKIYEVGGALRDFILNKIPKDKDYLVFGSNENEMKSLGFIAVGKQFPVFLHPKTHEEYALARKEKKTGSKHTDFEFIFDKTVTLEEDLNRRDFTCNALAFDPEKKHFFDFHNSIADIKNKTLRCVNKKSFKEDPLRVLRMCRFAAQLDFEVEYETLKLSKEVVREGGLKYLSAERIFYELERALECPKFFKFITVAHECEALKEILPEVNELWNVPEKPKYHPEKNSGDHMILCLKQSENFNARVKFAVLLHDIGKILTPKDTLPSHKNHDERGVHLIKGICSRLNIPKKYRNFAIICTKYHMRSFFINEMNVSTLVEFVESITKSKDDLEDFINVCFADTFGTLKNYSKKDYETFEQKANLLRFVFEKISKIHATEMPHFDKLEKNKSFSSKYREYKISEIKKALENEKINKKL